MKIAIFVVLISFVVAVRCNDFSLRDLNSLDFSQIFDYAKNLRDLKDVSQSRVIDDAVRARDYDRDKCIIELGTIADGLNRTEMWAIKCK